MKTRATIRTCMGREIVVDAGKHRILKDGPAWHLYCPARGPRRLLYAVSFDTVLFLYGNGCRPGADEHWPTSPGWKNLEPWIPR